MTPEEFNALCAELEDVRLDMRTVEPQSKYTCYEEWYADHIADLDDADKAEAADSLNSRRMTVNLEPETAQQWIRTLNWVIALQERTAESPDPDPEMRDFQRKCGEAASVLRVIRSEVNRWSLPEVIQPEELEQWRRNFDRDW